MLTMHAPPQCMVIDFRPNGEVEAMHRDVFDLGFLGKQTIRRATDIRHDEATQKWAIHLADMHADGPETFSLVDEAQGFETYDDARRMEVRWLEMCRLHSLQPRSPEGLTMLTVLRSAMEDKA